MIPSLEVFIATLPSYALSDIPDPERADLGLATTYIYANTHIDSIRGPLMLFTHILDQGLRLIKRYNISNRTIK